MSLATLNRIVAEQADFCNTKRERDKQFRPVKPLYYSPISASYPNIQKRVTETFKKGNRITKNQIDNIVLNFVGLRKYVNGIYKHKNLGKRLVMILIAKRVIERVSIGVYTML